MVKRKGLGQANTFRTNNNTSTGYGVAYADEVSGHRTVGSLADLYVLHDWQLSASGENTDNDAIGQLWYVVNADGNGNGCYYQLKDWSKRNGAAGWSIADYTTKAELGGAVENINTELDKKENTTNVDQKLSLKADLEEFNNTVSSINTNIATKANAQDVTNAIGELQDKIGDRVVVSGNVTNNPDEEDITTEGDTPQTQVLKLKDRAYDSLNASGKGYKILRKNWQPINGERKNVLTQEMINEPNTIYEIRYDFDLNGKTINIRNNAQLLFYGGMLSNGTIVFEGNIQLISEYQCFGVDVNIASRQIYKSAGVSKIKAIWFGAKADCHKYKLDEESTDNYMYLQKAIDIANQLRAPLILERGCYRISQSLNVPSNSIIIGEASAYNWLVDTEKYSNDTSRQTEILLDSTTHNIVFNVENQSTFKNLKIDGWKTKNVIAFYTKDFALNKSLFENLKICRCKCAFSINPAANQGFSGSTLKDINIYRCDAGFLFNGEGKTGTYITACVFNNVVFNECKAYCVNLITESNISDVLFNDCQVEYLNIGDEFNSEYYNQYGCHAFIFNSKGWQGLISMNSCYIEGVIPFKTVNGKNILNGNCSIEDISCIMFSNCLLSITNTRFANNLVLCDLKEKTQLYMYGCISDNTNVYKDDNIINAGLFRKTGTDISHISIDAISLKRNFIPFEGDNTYMRADIRNIAVDYIEYNDFKYLADENINIYIPEWQWRWSFNLQTYFIRWY